MTLPASGAISLNEMHIEAGGSTGTACTINDTDIRALVPHNSGVEMAFSDWYGKSSETIGEDWGGATYVWSDTASEESRSDYSQILQNTVNDGTFYRRLYNNGSNDETDFNWNSSAPSTTGSNYEAKYVHISGSAVSTNFTAENTWNDLGTSRWIAITDTVPNNTTVTVTYDVTIRKDGDASSEVTQRFTLNAAFGDGIAWPTTANTISTFGVGTTNHTGLKLLNDGNSQKTSTTGSYVAYDDWSNNPAGTGMDGTKYEVYWNKISGTTPDTAPTEDTWLDLGTTRTWQFNGGGTSQRTCVMDVTVRCDSQAGSEHTRRVTLSQTYEP